MYRANFRNRLADTPDLKSRLSSVPEVDSRVHKHAVEKKGAKSSIRGIKGCQPYVQNSCHKRKEHELNEQASSVSVHLLTV